ncbi:MAG TPA: YceI family protein [Saprospiraceae bacterium]|nr:YceI family protein [Saprospiraceae bacterium]
MQRVSKLIAPAFFSIIALFSCKNDNKPIQEAQVTPVSKPDTIRLKPVSTDGAETFVITEGVVNWLGKRTIGNRHTGTIKVAGGELLVKQGRLLSGKVTIDMRSISVNNMKDPGAKSDLESHLKDSDFFDVKNHPTGEFVFDEVLPSNTPDFNWVISGKLKLKDITNPVNIPVQMTISDDELNAESANFVINRTKWGVNFQSGLLGTVKDKIIEDIIPLSLTITAKKK